MIKPILKRIKRTLAYLIRCSGVFLTGLYCILMTLVIGGRSKPEPQPDKEVLLLGNGPSLNEIDLEKVATKYDIACVNWFIIKDKDKFFAIKPRYYFLIDPEFFFAFPKEWTEKRCNESKAMTGELKKIFASVFWDMKIIMPQGYLFEIGNAHITVARVSRMAICEDYMRFFLYFLHKHNFATCGMQNVLCGALHYFIMNKFRTVYLSGADMSEFKCHVVNERNHVLCHSPHFYETQTIDRTETGGIPLGDFYKHLGYYAKMLKEFHYLREFADWQKVKVINLSQQSYIDSFDKMSWKNLLS